MSSIFDLHHSTNAVHALDLSNITSNTTTDGEILDTAGYEALEFVAFSTNITDGVYTLSLFDGDDAALADAAVVSDEETLGSGTNFVLTDDNTAKRIGYIGKKRYVRLRVTSTGVTTGGNIGSVALLASARTQPQADD